MIDADKIDLGDNHLKGIVLAGGAGSRLYPLTQVVCKQLLPIYDKPMICYPLSVLMLAGIRDILLITTPRDVGHFERLLGDGKSLGLSISYAIQTAPRGIAEAILIGEQFLAGGSLCLVLGDNVFYGSGLQSLLFRAAARAEGATVFGYPVKDPERYGVVEIDADGHVTSLVEKPKQPRSNLAVPGLYFYDASVVDRARNLQPSPRGELEITDINQSYLDDGKLFVEQMHRGFAWLDTGTQDALLEAASFVQTIENRQGLKISCLEEIAYRMGFIDDRQLRAIAERMPEHYREYLRKVAQYHESGEFLSRRHQAAGV